MRRTLRALLAASAALIALAWAGCTGVDLGGGAQFVCHANADCVNGRVCGPEGICVAAGGDGGADSGDAGDAGDAGDGGGDADAGTDAGDAGDAGDGGEDADGGCVPEDNPTFCTRNNAQCGPLTQFDNCGTSRSVDDCGPCTTAGWSCGGGNPGTPNVCGCNQETDLELCTNAGAGCGRLQVFDRCGAFRSPDCGSCGSPYVCGANGSGNSCQIPSTCRAIPAGSPSTVYYVQYLNNYVYCDMATDGGGWTLALAYRHYANTSPGLSPGTPPQDPGAGSSHLSLGQLQSFLFEEARFYCRTDAHNRIIHFKTNNTGAINYLRGSGTNDASNWLSGVTSLEGHTGILPAATQYAYPYGGDYTMTYYTFYTGGTYWGIASDSNYWLCDDGYFGAPNPYDMNFQVWVR